MPDLPSLLIRAVDALIREREMEKEAAGNFTVEEADDSDLAPPDSQRLAAEFVDQLISVARRSSADA